jgi:hypothetical protein
MSCIFPTSTNCCVPTALQLCIGLPRDTGCASLGDSEARSPDRHQPQTLPLHNRHHLGITNISRLKDAIAFSLGFLARLVVTAAQRYVALLSLT